MIVVRRHGWNFACQEETPGVVRCGACRRGLIRGAGNCRVCSAKQVHRSRGGFESPRAGEWVQPIAKGYSMGCCDCGLVHRMDVRVYKGRVQFRVWRDEPATKKQRKACGITVKVHS